MSQSFRSQIALAVLQIIILLPLFRLSAAVDRAQAGAVEDLRRCVYASYDAPEPYPEDFCQNKIKQQYGIRNLTKHLEKEHDLFYNQSPPGGTYGNDRESTFVATIVERKHVNGVPVWFVDSSSGGIDSFEFRKRGIYFVNKLGTGAKEEVVIDVRASREVAEEIANNWKKDYIIHGGHFDRKAVYLALRDSASRGKDALIASAKQMLVNGYLWHELEHIGRNQDHSTAEGEVFAFLGELQVSKITLSALFRKATKSGIPDAHTQSSRIILGGFLASKDVKTLDDIMILKDEHYLEHINGIKSLLEKDFDRYSEMFLRYWQRSQRDARLSDSPIDVGERE